MKPFILIVLSIVICFALFSDGSGVEAKKPYKSKIKFCKFDIFAECLLEPLSYFTHQVNGSGIANSIDEMELFCFNVHDYFPTCARRWLRKCGSQIHEELIMKVLVEPFQSSFRVFCNPKGPIRSEFLKYSNCLIHSVKLSASYRSNCVRTLQAASEMIHENAKAANSFTQYIANVCCAYNQWEGCIVDHLFRNCGKPAADVFPNLIHHGSMMILKGICPLTKYDPENAQQCDKVKFVAPKAYKPKGLKSSSAISYFFLTLALVLVGVLSMKEIFNCI